MDINQNYSSKKYCGSCRKTLDKSKFSKRNLAKDGFQSACKLCQKKYRENPIDVSQYKFENKQIDDTIEIKNKLTNTNFRLKVYLSYRYVAGMNPFAISYIKKEFVSELKYNKWFECWKNKFQSEDYICVELETELLKNY